MTVKYGRNWVKYPRSIFFQISMVKIRTIWLSWEQHKIHCVQVIKASLKYLWGILVAFLLVSSVLPTARNSRYLHASKDPPPGEVFSCLILITWIISFRIRFSVRVIPGNSRPLQKNPGKIFQELHNLSYFCKLVNCAMKNHNAHFSVLVNARVPA